MSPSNRAVPLQGAAGLQRRLRELRVWLKQIRGIEPRIPVRSRTPLEFHGTERGGWMIVAGSLSPDSIVVDVGLGEDLAFSESIAARYECTVNGFDPTPRAIRHVKQRALERLRLFEYGLGTSSGPAEFFLPTKTEHVSGALNREEHLGQGVQVQLTTIGGVFDLVGCDRIDLLKLDIEGTEYDVFRSREFREYAGAIDQICVEFHHRWAGRGRRSTEQAARILNELGFECAWRASWTNEEFLFVRTNERSTRS